MTTSSRPRRLALLVATFALVAGCGGESSAPSDDVPALGAALERVDDAIVAGQYDDARTALDELVATTTTAREEGELGRGEADRILAAAAELGSALPETQVEEPAEEPAQEPTEEPEPTETTEEPTPTEVEPSEDDAEKEEEEEQKEEEKLQKELEKEAEKEAEDPGNSGENGSGEGKGND